MDLSNCPRCEAEPRRHGRDDGTGDYIYALECDCDDASGVESTVPGNAIAAWEERCRNVAEIMAEEKAEVA